MNEYFAILDTSDKDFDSALDELVGKGDDKKPEIVAQVSKIIDDVQINGDSAVLAYTKEFDFHSVERVSDLEVSRERFEESWLSITEEQRNALKSASERIFDFHQRQVSEAWQYHDEAGNLLGQRITPLNKVGVYVPGGKASYPSSVLMNVIPAKVAGVKKVVMMVPAPDGEINHMVLAAAHISGVDQAFMLGGAQAIAALAYGTKTLPMVDKIVGPGNQYVAEAKRQVFGRVGIDMIAGPSEILIICDGSTPPEWIVLDLFSQAEHDEEARVFLVSPDLKFLEAILIKINEILPNMDRKEIIAESLRKNGAIILTKDLMEAVSISNRLAPEHLELSIEDPESFLPQISAAGAIFLGKYTSESIGDYCAGPSHVLPTGGTARFASPLGVYDFQKRSSIVMCDPAGSKELCSIASILARAESLTAHAASAEIRLATLEK